jgi:hypothetical protein
MATALGKFFIQQWNGSCWGNVEKLWTGDIRHVHTAVDAHAKAKKGIAFRAVEVVGDKQEVAVPIICYATLEKVRVKSRRH